MSSSKTITHLTANRGDLEPFERSAACSAMIRARKQKKALQRRAFPSHIHNLPFEILALIFLTIRDAGYFSIPPLRPKSTAVFATYARAHDMAYHLSSVY